MGRAGLETACPAGEETPASNPIFLRPFVVVFLVLPFLAFLFHFLPLPRLSCALSPLRQRSCGQHGLLPRGLGQEGSLAQLQLLGVVSTMSVWRRDRALPGRLLFPALSVMEAGERDLLSKTPESWKQRRAKAKGRSRATSRCVPSLAWAHGNLQLLT